MIRGTQLLCIALATVTLLAVASNTCVVTAQTELRDSSSGTDNTDRLTFDQLYGVLRGGLSSLFDNIVTWLFGSGTKVGGGFGSDNPCWRMVPTENGWQWVWVCG